MQTKPENGAPAATKLEHSILDDLADWEAQLKPFRKDILTIVGEDE
jgi:hypothetical protein